MSGPEDTVVADATTELERAVLADIDAGENTLVDLLATLVRFRTPNPPGGNEAEAQSWVESHLSGLGLDVDRWDVLPGRSNVVGTWRGAGGGSSIVLNGHIDVCEDRLLEEACRSSVCIHETVCWPLRQRGLFASWTAWAASRNVGVLRRRLSASGSPLARASLRSSKAASLASARDTSGYPPRPMSRRRPSITSRCTQLFDPPGATFKNSVSPARYRPGFAIDFASAAVILFTGPLFPHHLPRYGQENMGMERNCQAHQKEKYQQISV